MSIKLLYIFLLCLFLSGCGKANLITDLSKISTIYTDSQGMTDDLRIVDSKTIVNRGDFGFITIQGRPETRYRISTSFSKDNRTISVNQWRVTGANGQATFNWVVAPDTSPGTYPATISGGGKSIDTYHTVNP